MTLRLTNLRGSVNQLGFDTNPLVLAFVASNGQNSLAVSGSQFVVGLPVRSLLASYSSAGVRCTGSPLPSSITFADLFQTGTRFFSTRVTEGYAEAFQKRDPFADTGVRIIARYSGFPAGARLFVPDVIAGSNAVQATSGGDLGLPPSGGAYSPGTTPSLLLVRVQSTDANGAGGTLAYMPGAPGSGVVAFNGVSEVVLAGGGGVAVYEVVDANPGLRESAQFPTFLGLAPVTGAEDVVARIDLSLAPVSTVTTASTSAPIPRFATAPPPTDCAAWQDCSASYFPRLVTYIPSLEYTAQAGGPPQTKYVPIQNSGGGILRWNASIAYKSGTGWLTLDPASGINNGTVRIDALPAKLAPGTYEATLTIDAGALAGSRTAPISIVVSPAPSPAVPVPATPAAPPTSTPVQPVLSKVQIRGIANLARPELIAVAPGSLATITGSGFSGNSVGVTFDGVLAKLLSVGAERIDLQVPASLTAKTSARLEVSVDGSTSAPLVASIAEVAPAIFANGVLNSDNTVNSAANGAARGSTLQIFATGLLAPAPGAVVVKLHDRFLTPVWSGRVAGYVGLDQVNVAIPEDLPAMTTEVVVCGFAAANSNQPVCSSPANVTLQ